MAMYTYFAITVNNNNKTKELRMIRTNYYCILMPWEKLSATGKPPSSRSGSGGVGPTPKPKPKPKEKKKSPKAYRGRQGPSGVGPGKKPKSKPKKTVKGFTGTGGRSSGSEVGPGKKPKFRPKKKVPKAYRGGRTTGRTSTTRARRSRTAARG